MLRASGLLLSFTYLFCSQALAATLLDYYPKCLSDDSITVTLTKQHFTKSPKDIDIREIDFMSEVLGDFKAEAESKGFEAVLLNRFSSQPIERVFKNQRTKYKSTVVATLGNLCADNPSLSTIPVITKANVTNIYNSNLAQEMSFTYEINVDLNTYRAPKPVSLDVSTSKAFGIALGTDETMLRNTLGDPDYRFVLTKDAGRLYGYGRGLWFLIKQGKVNQIQFGGQLLSYELINMLPADSPFDYQGWTLNGIKASNQNVESLTPTIAHWKSLPNRDKQIIEGDNRLTLQVEAFHPHSADVAEYRIKGFTLSYVDESPNHYQPNPVSLSLEKSVEWLAKSRQTDGKTIPAPNFNYQSNMMRDADGQIWYLLNAHMLIGVDEGLLTKLKLQPSWLANQTSSDVSGYLKALGLPTTKAMFVAEYPDYMDYYDRYEAFNAALDIAIQFESDSAAANVESATLIF